MCLRRMRRMPPSGGGDLPQPKCKRGTLYATLQQRQLGDGGDGGSGAPNTAESKDPRSETAEALQAVLLVLQSLVAVLPPGIAGKVQELAAAPLLTELEKAKPKGAPPPIVPINELREQASRARAET